MIPGRGPARLALLVPILLAVVALPWPAAGLSAAFRPERPRPGDVVLVVVRGGPRDLRGELGGATLSFFPVRGGRAALAGLDLDTEPGPLAWRLVQPMSSGGLLVVGRGALTLRPRSFETQRLALPPGQVDLDDEVLTQVRADRAELASALATSAPERLWRESFQTPIREGHPTGGFGLRRVINNQPRSPHTGFDWAAPVGTPVLAANTGRVALVSHHFFAGRTLVLDHGLGLHTLYFHLDETRVGSGESVRRGQPIGTVGASGRVTGPHLHFAVRLGGARVDPMALLDLVPPPDGP